MKRPSVIRIDQARREALADEIGELLRLQANWSPFEKRLKASKEELLATYESTPAEQPIWAEGKVYTVHFSARGEERTIPSMTKLFSALGKTVFLRLCRFPLAAFDGLTHPGKDSLVTSARTGSRTVKAVLKSAATATNNPTGAA